MKRFNISVMSLVLLSLLAASCARVPESGVWRPWRRSLQGEIDLPAGGAVETRVTGVTEPLLGDEQLLSESIRFTLNALLDRRGYAAVDSGGDYVMKLEYETVEREYTQLETYSGATMGLSSTYAGVFGAYQSSWGQGVEIARLAARSIALLSTSDASVVRSASGFRHVLAMLLLDDKGGLLWKGEASWISNSPEIRRGLVTAVQLLLSEFPMHADDAPIVRKLKETHVDAYLKTECIGREFACPALPSPIYFRELSSNVHIDDFISDDTALPAIVDLIQTAEFSLPTGRGRYDEPLEPDLWTHAMLGGEYRFSAESTPIKILVKLKGKTTGYAIEDAWVATAEEWKKFKWELENWRMAVAAYFDMYAD